MFVLASKFVVVSIQCPPLEQINKFKPCILYLYLYEPCISRSIVYVRPASICK